MKWLSKPNEKYYIYCDDWIICKVKVGERIGYELFQGNQHKGYFIDGQQAKAMYRILNER